MMVNDDGGWWQWIVMVNDEKWWRWAMMANDGGGY